MPLAHNRTSIPTNPQGNDASAATPRFEDQVRAAASSTSSASSGKSGEDPADLDLERAGMDVQVIEAQDYVGGRMVSKELSSVQAVDFGGQVRLEPNV